MNRSKVGLVLAGFLLAAGMGSASVLDSFGIISGEADVEGPTFYVAEIGGEQVLKVNEEPTESENFAYRSIGPGYSLEYFTSPDLGEGEWYNMTLDLYVKAKAMDNPGNVEAVVKYDNSTQEDITLCIADIYVDSTDDYEEFSSSCQSREESKIDSSKIKELTYKLSGGENKKYHIKPDGVTRIKVNAQ